MTPREVSNAAANIISGGNAGSDAYAVASAWLSLHGPKPKKPATLSRVVAERCRSIGLTVIGYTPKSADRPAVLTVACPHCLGTRQVLASSLNFWAASGRVPRCYGGLRRGCRNGVRSRTKHTHEADPCQTPIPTTAPTRTPCESASP